MRSALVALLLLVLASGCGSDGDPPAETTSLGSRMDFTLDAPLDSNPFDEVGTTVAAEFVSPGGRTIAVDAFAMRDYARSLVGGYEKLAPISELQWHVRFTPTEAGTWRWRPIVRTDAGATPGEWSPFGVADDGAARTGMVRRSARDPRYLEFEDGSPYFPIGENLCWYDGRGTFAYDDWFAKLRAQGVNYVRLWMPSWAFGLEWIERDGSGTVIASSLGDYGDRLGRAWQLDYVVEAARRHGIQVMLSIQNHGAFSLTNNSEWGDSPYNVANGGPLAAPRDLFGDPEARAFFRQRLRYIVARWGYAENIMTWELWNEVDLVDQPAIETVAAWHREMAAYLRDRDPFDRLISTSTGQEDAITPSSRFNALWELPEIDFVQAHFYAFGGAAADFTDAFRRIANRLKRFDKPLLIAEAGVDFRGPAETIEVDPHGDGFHDLLWAAPFVEAFGSGMTWWWDNVIDPLDLYAHFGALAKFVEGVDFPAEGFVAERTTQPADGKTLKVMSLRGSRRVLVWIKNASHLWHSPDVSEIAGATLTLGSLAAGEWRVRWMDTRSGVESVETARSDGGEMRLNIPIFARDIGLRLERIEGSNR